MAKTKPKGDRLLVSNLARWNVETFNPQIRRQINDKSRLEPLFPTYVFCWLDPTEPTWQAIRWAPGLAYFLNSGDELAVVPDSVIEYLRDKTRRWNEGATRSRFNRDDRVAIVDGPFAGLEAVFKDYLPSRKRCRVLLQAIQSISSVEVPEHDLEPVTSGNWRGRFAVDQDPTARGALI